MRLFRRQVSFLLVLTLCFGNVFAQVANEPVSIRNSLKSCETLFVSGAQREDSLGLPFSSSDPEIFKVQLQEQIQGLGREKFKDGTFFVLGVPMDAKHDVQTRFEQVLVDLNLQDLNIKIQTMPVPRALIAEEAVSLTQKIIQQVSYFLPSLTLDYQKPLLSEFKTGLLGTSVVEAPALIFLFTTLPTPEASLVAATNAIALTAYSLFGQSLNNWLHRSGFKEQRLKHIELFLKQMLSSIPFVASVNVLGRFGEILRYYAGHGFSQTMAAFPAEFASFATTQGFTLALQTIFYLQVITKGFGTWVKAQPDEQKSTAARVKRPLLQIPVLMLDALFLTAASSGWGDPLLTLGPAEINLGHAALLGLIAGGSAFFKYFPRALDRFLKVRPVNP